MIQKKIRGHNKIQRQIDNWQIENLSLDLSDYLLNVRNRCYAKISVRPWSDLASTNSVFPQPKGKTRQKLLNGLLDIYDNWNAQLDKLGQPYYLKFWLFEPFFSESQVVCAIGESVDFYENTFYNPHIVKSIQHDNYRTLKTRLSKLNWEYRFDEVHYDYNEVCEPDIYASRQEYADILKSFNKLLKKPHRRYIFKELIDERIETYSFKRGDLWLGGQNNKD